MRPVEEPESARDAIKASFEDAVRKSSIGHLAPGEVPRASSLLRAIGGIRGLIESILPGLGFLVVYTITHELVLSVLAPVAVALCFVAIRIISRTSANPSSSSPIETPPPFASFSRRKFSR